jgi:protein SCO1
LAARRLPFKLQHEEKDLSVIPHKVWTSILAAGATLACILDIGPAFAGNRWGADYFPNVELITHEGKTVRFYDDLLKGKSVAINVIFTSCPDVCPVETAKLRELQKILGERVGNDIFFYSISTDPIRDTPPVLKAYAEKFNVGPGWLFLTGKAEDIALVTKKLGLLVGRDTGPRENHSSSLMIGKEPTGQWMKNSATDNPRFLAATMETFLGWTAVQPQKAYTEARPIKISNGQFLFQNGCSACHTIGKGDKVGPDLLGVTERRDREWLTRYILVPDEMLAANDPIATTLFKKYKEIRMPNLGLARDEVAELLAYVEASTANLRKRSDTR